MQTSDDLRRKLALLLMLAIVSWPGLPWSPRQESSFPNRAPLPMLFPFSTQAVADLDGDRLPDRAELISEGFQKNIQLTFSSHWAPSLHFSSEIPQPGSIYAEDIDRDSDDDLIWVSEGQPAHSAIWLNNGTGDLARVSDTAAYAIEIKRLVAGGSHNGPLASSVSGQLRATATIGFNLLSLPDDHLPETPHSTSLKSSRRDCGAVISSCAFRYPKRGPPLFSPEFIGFNG